MVIKSYQREMKTRFGDVTTTLISTQGLVLRNRAGRKDGFTLLIGNFVLFVIGGFVVQAPDIESSNVKEVESIKLTKK